MNAKLKRPLPARDQIKHLVMQNDNVELDDEAAQEHLKATREVTDKATGKAWNNALKQVSKAHG